MQPTRKMPCNVILKRTTTRKLNVSMERASSSLPKAQIFQPANFFQTSNDSVVEQNGFSPSCTELNDGDVSLFDSSKAGLTSQNLNDFDKEKAPVELSEHQNFDSTNQETGQTLQNFNVSDIERISEQQPALKEGLVPNECAADTNETVFQISQLSASAAVSDEALKKNNKLSSVDDTATEIEQYADSLLAGIQPKPNDLSTNSFGSSDSEIISEPADASVLVSSFSSEEIFGETSQATILSQTKNTLQKSNSKDNSFNSQILSPTELQYQRKRSTFIESQDPRSPLSIQTTRNSSDYQVTTSINDNSYNLSSTNQNTESKLQASVVVLEELLSIKNVDDFKSTNKVSGSASAEIFQPIENGSSSKTVNEEIRFAADDGHVYTLPGHKFREEIPVKGASNNHEKEDIKQTSIGTSKSKDQKPTDKEQALEKFQTGTASSATTNQQTSVPKTLEKARKTAYRYTIIIIIASVSLVLVIGAIVAMSIVFTRN